MHLAEKIIAFNQQLQCDVPLPEGIRMMNPFREAEWALPTSTLFYSKYYNDANPRFFIIGINPGRFGGGITGIPFTDPKRLLTFCDITFGGPITHEPSSAFVYEMIEAFGGASLFYQHFYINSACPLGFTATNNKGKPVNYNYYDSPHLLKAVQPFMVQSLQQQFAFGLYHHTAFCFGTGKNEYHLQKLNEVHGFFDQLIALEHPRYIMQYHSKQKEKYIEKYLSAFSTAITHL